MADCIRNQLTSGGVLRTWKFNNTMSGIPAGHVEYTEKIVNISEERRAYLKKCEERRRLQDLKIQRGRGA